MQTHFLQKSDRQLSEAINKERRESFNPSRTIRSAWEDFFRRKFAAYQITIALNNYHLQTFDVKGRNKN